jgi:hypothetical protein
MCYICQSDRWLCCIQCGLCVYMRLIVGVCMRNVVIYIPVCICMPVCAYAFYCTCMYDDCGYACGK